jgi:hypothetical protein
MKNKLNLKETILCETSSQNNGNPFVVSVLAISKSGKIVTVKTQGMKKEVFDVRITSLYNN